MPDSLLVFAAPSAGLRVAVCTARELSVEAKARHGLRPGSAGALAHGMTAALLLAAHERTRVDVQLECNGPLRGLLADADESGVVRGLVRVSGLEGAPRAAAPERFDARPMLASGHDERAGRLSILRAPANGHEAHRAAFPFAGADLGAALTFYLRGDREQGGEMAIEALASAEDPLAAVAGALISPLPDADPALAQALGKPMRQGGLLGALRAATDAQGIADALASKLGFGPLRRLAEARPRFSCRCSRERVERALRSLGAAELRDMAAKDGGASLTCDFCNAGYAFTAEELVQLAQR